MNGTRPRQFSGTSGHQSEPPRPVPFAVRRLDRRSPSGSTDHRRTLPSDSSGAHAAESVIPMCESRFDEKVLLPTACPFCGGRQIEPVTAHIGVTTSWRCRACAGTWQVRQLCQDGG